jgi:hypothetical protein
LKALPWIPALDRESASDTTTPVNDSASQDGK